MKNFNILNFLIVTLFATAQITPAELIYYEYNAPDETGAMKRQAEKLKLIQNRYIRDELTEAQIKERAAQEIAFKTAYEKQKEKITQADTTTQKITALIRKNAAIKLQRATRSYLKEKQIDQFKTKINQFAEQSYPKFKELICTADYITKTDWIYQFIETLEAKKIFERDKNGKINPDTFTAAFKKQISNPNDWLDEKRLKYLPEFHAVMYEVFIDQAVNQITQHKTSWTDAVSIPTPKGHGSLQAEGTPLYPKVYKCLGCPRIHLVLAKIFTEVFEKDPTRFEELQIEPTIMNISGQALHADGHTAFKDILIKAFGRNDMLTISYDVNDPDFDEPTAIMQDIEKHDIMSGLLKDYLDELGLEISSEEAKAAMISDDYLRPIEPKDDPANYSIKNWQKLWDVYFQKLEQFETEQQKFIEDHINWASSARQTFLLGQLIFDHDMQALDKLGGNTWLAKQPEDVAKAISEWDQNLLQKIKSERLAKMKETFEKSKTNRFSDLNTMDIHF